MTTIWGGLRRQIPVGGFFKFWGSGGATSKYLQSRHAGSFVSVIMNMLWLAWKLFLFYRRFDQSTF